MRNLIPQRSGNPSLNDKTFVGLETTGATMTLDGTVNRTFALVAILLAGALVTVLTGPAWAFPGAIAGFILALVTIFRKQWAPITAPLYAFAEGLFIGGFSVILEDAYPGIMIPAVSLTVAVFVAFLLIYRSHIIPVTDKLRIAIVAARAPKYMEWYGAFALLVTLVWLYVEILRLLSRLRRR